MSITSRTIAIVLSMALVAVISIPGTRAAFSGETLNAGNEFDSATIDLTDDDGDVVMFNVAGMLPGDTLDHCILVTYTGPAGRDSNGVNVFIPSYTPSAGDLDADLLITVEEGTDATPVFDPAGTRTGVQDGLACSSFTPVTAVVTDEPLSTFATTYATGYGTWQPIVTDTNTTQYYRITVKLATASTADGESVTAIPFTWRVEAGS